MLTISRGRYRVSFSRLSCLSVSSEGGYGTPVEVREEHGQPNQPALGVAALNMFDPDDVGAPHRQNGPCGPNKGELSHL